MVIKTFVNMLNASHFLPSLFIACNLNLFLWWKLLKYCSLIFQHVGCDYVINSNAKEDHCGVCRGDASTCETIKDQYNETQGLGKTIVVFVEEMGPLVKQSKTNLMKHRD